jgi:alkyl hydroperoxide reductase subunit F
MYDLIVIGGGPAGLAATIYALRKHLEVLLITQDLGGQTNQCLQLPEIKHHLVINGEDVVNRFSGEIEYLNYARVIDRVEKVATVEGGYRIITEGNELNQWLPQAYESRALIVATGGHPKLMDVPGEKEYIMRGLCFSAITYASLFIDHNVTVVGDKELALLAAMELALIAKQVTLVAPEHGDLDTPLGQKLQNINNVIILEGYQPIEVKGDDYARSLMITKHDRDREIESDVIFVELGLVANSNIVKNLVDLEADGRIQVDSHNRTSKPGIFAAGDVTNVYAEQVLIAIGEGAKAALGAHKYLLNHII